MLRRFTRFAPHHVALHLPGAPCRENSGWHLTGWLSGLLGAVMLAGCANPMQRQASADCDPEAYRIFPRVLQSQRVTEPVVVQVPDGSQHCVTELIRPGDRTSAITRCVPNYTVQTRWAERWVNIDLNAKEREIWHQRCVQQLCVERTGNTACETPAPMTPSR